MYVRTVKVRSTSGTVNEYVRVVEAYREDGKVKQRVVADLGRKDLLVELLPKLRRLLTATPREPRFPPTPSGRCLDLGADPRRPGLVRPVGPLVDPRPALGQAKGVPFADRAFVLVANRLIPPASEHGLAGWLETDFVCDRKGRRFIPHWHQRRRVRVHPRQLDAWYRTLDQLHRPRTRSKWRSTTASATSSASSPTWCSTTSPAPTSRGPGPHDFAKHGYSRDGKSQNVQVIVGVVMVAGWPIAHHVWAGNRIDHSTVQEVIGDLRKRFEFGRIVFVGDRGMVTDENIESITKDEHGFLVGVKRRRNPHSTVGSTPSTTPSGSTVPAASIPGNGRPTRRAPVPRKSPPEIPPACDRHRLRRAPRLRAGEARTGDGASPRATGEAQGACGAGGLKRPEKIGAAVERIMQKYHGYRYFDWKLREGALEFSESETRWAEKRIEGKYVIMTTEKGLERPGCGGDVQGTDRRRERVPPTEGRDGDAADLSPDRAASQGSYFCGGVGVVGSTPARPPAQEAGVDLSPARAMQALATVRLVTFRLKGQPERRGLAGGCPDARLVLKALKLVDQRPPAPPEGEDTVM